jgi:predicted nucleotidyltransferase
VTSQRRPLDPESVAAGLAACLGRAAAPVLSAYLFGSLVSGRAHTESDVDVGVLLSRAVCPTSAARFEVRVRLSAELPAIVGARIVDVVVLNDAPPHLARRVVTSGRRVYCADAAADHAFVRDVQLRAADLEPFLRRTRRIKIEALGR